MGVCLVGKLCRSVRYYKIVFVYIVMFCLFPKGGCGSTLLPSEQVRGFEKVKLIASEVDVDGIIGSKNHTSPDHVVPSDILGFQILDFLRVFFSAAFPCSPDVQCNLIKALVFAGGFDMTFDPRYWKIYWKDASGEIVCSVYKLSFTFARKYG